VSAPKRPYDSPRYSKGRVDRAGQRIGTPDEVDDDRAVLENWRASHANILNTFKTVLYNRTKGLEVQIAQRLKRRPTILDKLVREPDMRLSRMHDIAGCRVIFVDLDDLYEFRSRVHNARFDHKRRGVDDDRWNYIDRPKQSGYRGIHDVYTYHVEPKKGIAREKQPWNGMLVEIQYRTAIQHAWATAVELAGLVTENNPKFDRGSQDFIDFFRVASEILARAFEGVTSCCPELSNEELLRQFNDLESRTHILRLFSELRKSEGGLTLTGASILIFRYVTDLFSKDQLEIKTFESVNVAIQEYNRLEQELSDSADIVLVGSRSGEAIKSAYRNYFSDAQEFISLIQDGIGILESNEFFIDGEPGDGLVET
jgi:putative GTP pyrophosphokinase